MIVRIVLIFAFLVVMIGCRATSSDPIKSGDLNYQIIRVEGMPCLIVQSTSYGPYTIISITCDWSKWKGSGQ